MANIDAILVGPRFRKNLGNLDDLAASIDEIGLLHPVVITSDMQLIAGQRRLEACRTLGWTEIPVTVIAINEIVRGEYAENAIRKDFLPSEIDAIRRAMEPAEKEAAVERMSDGGKGWKLSTPSEKTRDKIGEFAGVSGRTVEKIARVVEAAEAEPDKYGYLVEEMDRTGKIDGPYQKVRRDERHAEIRQNVKTKTDIVGPFPLIYADPPWTFETYSWKGQGKGPAQHYPTLTDDEIMRFCIDGRHISEIAHRDAALFMWCTSSNLLRALPVLEAWGFTYKTQAVWDKQRPANGQIFLNQHEILLYGSRGSIPAPANIRSSVFSYPRGHHSEKPKEIRQALEEMYPHFDESSRIELFARNKQRGWTTDGYESQ
jgi:N6-adenosine-specific RNA methylase IME4